MRNFKLLAQDVYVQPLLDKLRAKPELWNDFTGRQHYPGSAHTATRTILLYGPETIDLWAWFNALHVKPYPAYEVLGDALHQLTRLLPIILNGHNVEQAGRVMLVELKAGGRIPPHRDDGAYAGHFQRLHLVLTGSCTFNCGNEAVVMLPGELWWFNHRERHWVENDATEPRVNLILDVRLDSPITA